MKAIFKMVVAAILNFENFHCAKYGLPGRGMERTDRQTDDSHQLLTPPAYGGRASNRRIGTQVVSAAEVTFNVIQGHRQCHLLIHHI